MDGYGPREVREGVTKNGPFFCGRHYLCVKGSGQNSGRTSDIIRLKKAQLFYRKFENQQKCPTVLSKEFPKNRLKNAII